MSSRNAVGAGLAFRNRKILYAVCSEYISTGQPVGSRTLAKRYAMNLSPASIRNVLADLHDSGHLSQPHTSAGRIPTDLGFRVFVDALVKMRRLSQDDQATILSRLSALGNERDEIVKEAGRVLSSMSGAAAVITPPRPEEERLADLRFIPLPGGKLLAVIVTEDGSVENRVVDSSAGGIDLDKLHNFLSERAKGMSLQQLRDALATQVTEERENYEALRKQAEALLSLTIDASSEGPKLLIQGQGVLFDRPEFSDVEKLRRYLAAFEEREQILEVLERTLSVGGVQVLIGAETEIQPAKDISVVSANYMAGGSSGTVGIIGPTRMDYAALVPLVGFTAKCMSELLGSDDSD